MRYAFLILLLAALPVPACGHDASRAADAEGFWLNPKRTVAVRAAACGEALCARIVWASMEARNDAAASSVPHLLGTEVLEDYRFRGNGVWTGTIFVPDMGRRFASRIEELSPTQLRIKGCVLRGLLCKSQVWTRIGDLPA